MADFTSKSAIFYALSIARVLLISTARDRFGLKMAELLMNSAIGKLGVLSSNNRQLHLPNNLNSDVAMTGMLFN